MSVVGIVKSEGLSALAVLLVRRVGFFYSEYLLLTGKGSEILERYFLQVHAVRVLDRHP